MIDGSIIGGDPLEDLKELCNILKMDLPKRKQALQERAHRAQLAAIEFVQKDLKEL